MAAFLLTWNPRVFPWSDLQRDIAKLRGGRKLVTDWSCARSKRIRKGDRLWLLRQGVEPRGIVARGRAVSDWYEGPGWRRLGVPCHYVDWEIEVLLDAAREPILPRELLSTLGPMNWNTMVSGITVPEPVARELEKVFRAFANR
ncbi:MAG TPA: hypothetical protein VGH20_00685 [Myxococcales bacterium]